MTKWVTKKLGEIASLQGGFAFQSKDFADDGIPLIRIGDITAKGLNTNNSAKLPSYFLDEHTEFALKADDTIIAMSGATVGKCTLVTEKDIPALLNQRVGRFKVKNCIDKKFVYYTVSNYSYQQKLLLDAIGGAQPNVSPRQIESVPCPIPVNDDGTPDLTEQKRIASILSSADNVITTSEALIEKYKSIKQGMLTDLLTPKKGWKKVKLGECCHDIFSGKNVSRQDFGKYVVYGSTGVIGYTDKYEYDFDALLIARVGANAGLVNKVSGKYDVSDNTLIVKLLDVIDLTYLYYLLILMDLNQFVFGSGQPLVTAGLLKKLEISVPYKNGQSDLAEQHRIAGILSSVDAKIAAEEKVLEKYKGVKKGLMEEMMDK